MSHSVLIHRYDNEADILAVEERGYSDVYDKSRHDEFDLVIVLPTGSAKTQVTVVADAMSGQLNPEGGEPWPGRDDHYGVRVYVENVRYTTHARVRQALIDAGQWVGQWKVKWVVLDVRDLFDAGNESSGLIYRSATPTRQVSDPSLEYVASELNDIGEFDPVDVEDARRRVLRLIAARQGQPDFRRRLIEAYSGRCAISDCDAKEALEAAHIFGYMGPATNLVQNGLLLRADLHTLFDRGLVGIVPGDWSVILSPELHETAYAQLDGLKVQLPRRKDEWPSPNALRAHLRASGFIRI